MPLLYVYVAGCGLCALCVVFGVCLWVCCRQRRNKQGADTGRANGPAHLNPAFQSSGVHKNFTAAETQAKTRGTGSHDPFAPQATAANLTSASHRGAGGSRPLSVITSPHAFAETADDDGEYLNPASRDEPAVLREYTGPGRGASTRSVVSVMNTLDAALEAFAETEDMEGPGQPGAESVPGAGALSIEARKQRYQGALHADKSGSAASSSAAHVAEVAEAPETPPAPRRGSAMDTYTDTAGKAVSQLEKLRALKKARQAAAAEQKTARSTVPADLPAYVIGNNVGGQRDKIVVGTRAGDTKRPLTGFSEDVLAGGPSLSPSLSPSGSGARGKRQQKQKTTTATKTKKKEERAAADDDQLLAELLALNSQIRSIDDRKMRRESLTPTQALQAIAPPSNAVHAYGDGHAAAAAATVSAEGLAAEGPAPAPDKVFTETSFRLGENRRSVHRQNPLFDQVRPVRRAAIERAHGPALSLPSQLQVAFVTRTRTHCTHCTHTCEH